VGTLPAMARTDVTPAGATTDRRAPGTLAAAGALLALLVAADGSPLWQLLRAVAVLAVTAAVWSVQRSDRAAGWVLLGGAAVALAVGIGIGVRWSSVDGLSWRAAVALAELPVGVALLVAGISGVVAGLRRSWRVLAVPALVLLVAIVVSTLAPAVLATNVPPISPGATAAGRGLDAAPVTFTTDDGIELFGWYVPPSGDGAAVVLRHGAGDSTADSVVPQAAVLAGHGYGVLATDARGHARSEGRAMDFGWYGDADIEAAVSFLADQPGVDPDRIGVVGLSMGGEEAIGAAAADPRIGAVVAEGATARTDRDKAWFADEYGLRGRLQLGLERIQYTMTDLLTDASMPTALPDAVADAAPTPILLIAAGEVADEQHAAAHLAEESPSTVTVWVVPDAGHTDGLDTAPDEWEERVVGFLADAL
jgi:dienelactone hydrolase